MPLALSAAEIVFVIICCTMLDFLNDWNLKNSLLDVAIPEVRRGAWWGSPESLLYRFVPSVLQILICCNFLFLVPSWFVCTVLQNLTCGISLPLAGDPCVSSVLQILRCGHFLFFGASSLCVHSSADSDMWYFLLSAFAWFVSSVLQILTCGMLVVLAANGSV